MADDAPQTPPPDISEFLGEPTRDLGRWRWLWHGDHPFPIRSHRGGLGRLLVVAKRLVRPLVKVPLNDLWERQRTFNLILLEHLERQAGEIGDLRARLGALRQELSDHGRRLEHLERFFREGLGEVMEHNDALFSRVDQKLDAYRRQTRDLWARLGGALARLEEGEETLPALARARREHAYLELEARLRGTEVEIAERLLPHADRLAGGGEVLDLGCGRGEALAVLAARGIPARGVDSSAAMVAECVRQGLRADEGDLFEVLAGIPEGTLGGVTSFHVIEHLPPTSLDRLIRLAWRALRPGGVLILETPNPLSLVVAARNFWLDPTHQRPVHPATLKLLFELAGFDPVERLDLRPFPERERLPEIALEPLPEGSRLLADRVNRLRDRLDELLFGFQDYAVIGTRPPGPAERGT